MVLNYNFHESTLEKKLCILSSFIYSFCVAGYLKHSNDTSKLNIHKYTNFNIIEIYINRLSITPQIFIAMDYLTMMSEKYLYFKKRKKHLARKFFPHPVKVTGSMYFGNIFGIICFSKICAKTWKKLEYFSLYQR